MIRKREDRFSGKIMTGQQDQERCKEPCHRRFGFICTG